MNRVCHSQFLLSLSLKFLLNFACEANHTISEFIYKFYHRTSSQIQVRRLITVEQPNSGKWPIKHTKKLHFNIHHKNFSLSIIINKLFRFAIIYWLIRGVLWDINVEKLLENFFISSRFFYCV